MMVREVAEPTIPAVDIVIGDPDDVVAFELTCPGADARSAVRWARAVWETAPRPVRWFLPAGWVGGLGLRLDRRPVEDRVLGRPIVRATPRAVVLAADSPLMTAHNVVGVDATAMRWTTLVRFRGRLGRVLWTVAAPVHRVAMRLLLARAAGG
jgi:hypothetical protein